MERKLYPCKECGTKVPIRSKGLCPACRQKQRQQDGTLPVYKKSIKQISDRRKKIRSEERGCLGRFFEYHIEQLQKKPFSEESGQLISEPTSANVCHLLPKRKQGGFPSVQCLLENCVYLTLQEHNKFDKLLDERNFKKLEEEFPNSWKKTCKKLEKLLTLCTERNKMYFSLKDYLDGNTNIH